MAGKLRVRPDHTFDGNYTTTGTADDSDAILELLGNTFAGDAPDAPPLWRAPPKPELTVY